MPWLSVNKSGMEYIHTGCPERHYLYDSWISWYGDSIWLPTGSIKKLIGKELTWEDEPFEYE